MFENRHEVLLVTGHEDFREKFYLPDAFEQLNNVKVPIQSPECLLVLQFFRLFRRAAEKAFSCKDDRISKSENEGVKSR